MTFADFAQHLKKIEAVSARLAITAQLAELFEELKPAEIPFAVYLSLGRLVPEYIPLEFQLSAKMIMRVLTKHLARHPDKFGEGLPVTNLFEEADDSLYEDKVMKLYKQLGDIGETAEAIFAKNFQGKSTVTITEVYQALKVIAEAGGAGSQERKVNGLLELFEKLDPNSIRFVARIVVGKLRLGFSTMTVLDALSWTKHGNKSDTARLEELFQRKADLGLLAQTYLEHADFKAVEKAYNIELGIPIVPALCQRLNSAAEIIAKMPKVIVEPKYDGLRIQIHVGSINGKRWVRSFTRNLEETSHMYPELMSNLKDLKCKDCILDGEVMGVDKKTGKLLPFQDTSTRRRKHGVKSKAAELPIKIFLFDALQKDGQSLIDTPLFERKKILSDIVGASPVFVTAPFIVTTDPKELHAYHSAQLKLGLEGAVIKKYDSVYKSGRKGWRWVKIKEEEGTSGKLSDTLDCIVMGYYKGRGKRTVFGVGAFLVGLLGKDEKILTIAKIGTGLTDEQFRELKRRIDQHAVKKQPASYEVNKNLLPDGWVEPSLVVEIAADEITRSPIHSAGKALRFPRLVNFRDDKSWQDATTIGELKNIQ
jgi:DNA ligase-1